MAFSYFCPHCGKHFDAPGICPLCQVSLLPHPQQATSENRYCTRCGARISMKEQLFCTSCGAPLSDRVPQQSYGIPPQKKKFPVWGMLGIVLGSVLILIFAVLVLLFGFGILSSERSATHPNQWYQDNGGYSDSQDEPNGLVHTNAKILITSLTYGTGEDLGFLLMDGQFVEVGLNIINTQDRTITLSSSNFYLTEDATGEKIYPYSEMGSEKTSIQIEANEAVAGALSFEIRPDAAYHFNFIETDGTLISSFALNK